MAARPSIDALTGLRGLAAWWVVLYHVRDAAGFPQRLDAFIAEGALAVDLFFVMSGYVMALSYGEAFRTGVGLRRWAWFLVLRLGRVYPLHLLVLAAYLTVPAALLATGRPVPSWRFPTSYLLESLVLVQNWGFSGRFSWNLPAWSISTELMFYLVFPFAAWGAGGLAARRSTLVASGCAILAGILAMGWVTGSLIFETPRYGALRCISECLLGMWLFHAVARAAPRGGASLGLLAAAAALAWCYALGLLPDYAAMPLAFALLIAAATDAANPAARLLATRIPLFLGEISFSTYIVHYLIKDWVKLLFGGRLDGAAVLAIYAAAVLAASVLLHAVVERPARLASRRLAADWFRGAIPGLSAGSRAVARTP